MEARFEIEFLIRRIGQLWAQAAGLPEKSSAQAQIKELACKLSDYVSELYLTMVDCPPGPPFSATPGQRSL